VLLDMAASTVGEVLTRAGLPRLADVDRLAGQLLLGQRHSRVRYERPAPDDLLHVAVKNSAGCPTVAAGVCTAAARRSVAAATASTTCASPSTTHPTAVHRGPARRAHRHLRWAVAWRTRHGVTIARVLTDNAKNSRVGTAWTTACT
jgi:transposase InsO family protein